MERDGPDRIKVAINRVASVPFRRGEGEILGADFRKVRFGFHTLAPSPSPTPYHSPDASFMLETPSRRGRGLQRHRRVSDTSMLSADLGYEYPSVSSCFSSSRLELIFVHSMENSRDSHDFEGDPQHILSSMQNSMWGGSYPFCLHLHVDLD